MARIHKCLNVTIENKENGHKEITRFDCMPDNKSHKEAIKCAKKLAKEYKCVESGLFTWESDFIKIRVEEFDVDLDNIPSYHKESWDAFI